MRIPVWGGNVKYDVFRDRMPGWAERVGFDAVLDGLREAGLVKRRGKQRLDSPHVLGAVARMSRLEAVRETIRLFLEHVERVGTAWGGQICGNTGTRSGVPRRMATRARSLWVIREIRNQWRKV